MDCALGQRSNFRSPDKRSRIHHPCSKRGSPSGLKKPSSSRRRAAHIGEQEQFPAAEEAPKRPASPYGVASYGGKLSRLLSTTFGDPLLAYATPNVYGPRQNFRGEAGVIAVFIALTFCPERSVTTRGRQTRDFVYGAVAAANSARSIRPTSATDMGTSGWRRSRDLVRQNPPADGSKVTPPTSGPKKERRGGAASIARSRKKTPRLSPRSPSTRVGSTVGITRKPDLMSSERPNFSIIAPSDHGKSTLADRVD